MSEKSEKKVRLSEEMQRQFLEHRKVFFWGQVNDKSCEKLMNEIFFLDAAEPGKEIILYLSSPGGSVSPGLAVYDAMGLIASPIAVVVTGMAASMGSILLSGGKKGRRFIYPHARVLLHQPLISGQFEAPAVDIGIHAQDIEKQRHELNEILASASGQPLERVEKDTDRDFYLDAKEALEYGLVDYILTRSHKEFGL